MARLFRERANVQAAQDFCQTEPGEAEAGLRIAIHVWLFTTPTRGMSARADSGSASCWPGLGSSPSGGAQALVLAGLLATVSGDRDAGLPRLAEGTGLARQLNDPATRAFAAWLAGMACLYAGDCNRPLPTTKTGWRSCPRPLSMTASAPTCCSPWRSPPGWPVTKSAPSPVRGSLPR